ncbi:MAG: hypothetical protein ACJA2W_000650 [Planctomycetota bacterium]|jgi:hypothetical protein
MLRLLVVLVLGIEERPGSEGVVRAAVRALELSNDAGSTVSCR